jgi:hypothetical protein
MMPAGVHPNGRASDVFLYALFMLGPSQAILFAFWVALGGGKFLWRVVPAVVGLVVYMWCFKTADQEWLITTMVQLGIGVVLLLAGRVTGLELSKASDMPDDSRPFQFYVRDILAWTTALAVVLSALRCMTTDWLFGRSMQNGFAIFGSVTFVAAASMFCSMGRRWMIVRIALLALSIGFGVVVLLRATGDNRMWLFPAMLGLMAAWLCGSLFVVRLAGYRLTWRWRFRGGPVPDDPQP